MVVAVQARAITQYVNHHCIGLLPSDAQNRGYWSRESQISDSSKEIPIHRKYLVILFLDSLVERGAMSYRNRYLAGYEN